MQFFTLVSSKIEHSKTYFFHIVTTKHDHPRYVKHGSDCIHVFFTLFGYWVHWGRSPKRLVHNLLLQFLTLGSSKIKLFENYSSEPVTT